MSATHVVDASAVLKVVLDEPEAPAFREWYTRGLRSGDRFVAPGLLPYELANALWHRVAPEARKDPDWTRRIVRDLLIAVELDHDAWARVDPWNESLSAYDACYLGLAVAVGASLVTYDDRLADAAAPAVDVIRPE